MSEYRPRFIDPRDVSRDGAVGDFPGQRAASGQNRVDIDKQQSAAVSVRPAALADVDGLARVSIASWRETYRGILPDEKLDSLDHAERVRLWTGLVERPGQLFHHVAITASPTATAGVVGFISVGTTRSHRLPYPWEIYSFYVMPGWLRRGIGRRLIVAAFREILKRDGNGCCLWVLSENVAARKFYQAMGGKVVAKGAGPLEGVMLNGEVFAWEDLDAVCVAIGIEGAAP